MAASTCAGSFFHTETASAGMPHMAPSRAAATVPEYTALMPAFSPRLMPETSRSGRASAQRWATANLTQSQGVPATW